MYGEITGILTGIFFALSFVLARKIENEARPIFQNAIRSLVGFLTFFIICLFFGVILEIFSLPIIIVSLLIMSITFTVILGDTAYLYSQKILGPTKALAITTTTPFFTILFALFFLNRQFSLKIIFSAILIAIGVIIITGKDIKTNNKSYSNSIHNSNFKGQNELRHKFYLKTLKGSFWALFTAISWATGIALSDYSISQVDQILGLGILSTMIAMMVRFLFAFLFLSAVAYIEEKRKPLPKSRTTWKILIISAILSYSIGSLFFGEAVHTAGATFMSLISTAMPLFTIPFSYLINKEKLSRKGFLGVIITLVGVLLILF
ncbi:MAG: DMT family transporter [Promethearchaeota archaeon]